MPMRMFYSMSLPMRFSPLPDMGPVNVVCLWCGSTLEDGCGYVLVSFSNTGGRHYYLHEPCQRPFMALSSAQKRRRVRLTPTH